MRIEKQIGKRERAAWALGLVISLVAIFKVPYFFPVAPTVSTSYIFGYNNRVGVVLFFFFLLLVGLLARRLGVTFPPPEFSAPVSRGALVFWTMAFALIAIMMWWLAHGLNGFGESPYFISRLNLLVGGERPYRDFEFAYGVLMLWIPASFTHLSLDVENSYFLFWAIVAVSGVWLLARVINMLDVPSRSKTRVFHLYCIYASFGVLCMGTNYVLPRFLLATWFGLIVQRIQARDLRRAMGVAIGCTVILLGVSPEAGVFYATGIILYFAVFGWLRGLLFTRSYAFPLSSLILTEGIILFVANKFKIFETLLSFRTGSFNFPIVPAVHILFFFGCCAVVTMFLMSRLRDGARGDAASMALAVSMLGIFAALGRCDSAHIVYNGLAILLIVSLLISEMPRAWVPFQCVLFLVLGVPMAIGLHQSKGAFFRLAFIRVLSLDHGSQPSRAAAYIEQGMVRQLGAEKGRAKFLLYRKIAHTPSAFDVRPILGVPQETLEAPFDFRPTDYGSNLMGLDPGFYMGFQDALTSQSIERKLAELEAHPARKLLLPADYRTRCTILAASDREVLRRLFLYPYNAQPKNTDDIWIPFCAYIDTHYVMEHAPTPDSAGYGVWDPR